MRFVRLMTAAGPQIAILDDREVARPAVFAATRQTVSVLQEVISAGPDATVVTSAEDPGLSGRLLAPHVPGRNVFCVGRNYSEHAAEFARSGYDATGSTGGADVPEFPVVFTKPAASIIASGDLIDPHADITSSLDYEGEIGVIIGRRASKVSKAEAMNYVWGYTLINDMTARDLQRDHKQWFIGKSLDTFCPMGPWAVTADEIDLSDLALTTTVNGELRQDSNTAKLIFDVPTLIETLSSGITLEPGDVIATGTPAGVGIGFDPPKFLAVGDEVVVAAPGLGELRNRIGTPQPASGIKILGGRQVYVEKTGTGPAVVLVHGLGGTTGVWEPQVEALSRNHTVIRFDLRGHGRSPQGGPVSIDSWAEDLIAVLDDEGVTTASLVAHSMGTLVAVHAALTAAERFSKVALLGVVRRQADAARTATLARAATVRAGGMAAVANTIVAAGTSDHTRTTRPVTTAFVREILLGQDAEGYAAACEALAAAAEPDYASLKAPVLLITGSEDRTSPLAVNEAVESLLPSATSHILDGVGHWHSVEAPEAVTDLLVQFLKQA